MSGSSSTIRMRCLRASPGTGDAAEAGAASAWPWGAAAAGAGSFGDRRSAMGRLLRLLHQGHLAALAGLARLGDAHRDGDGEGGALPGAALDRDVAAVGLADVPHQGQADARAAHVLLAHRSGAV